MTNEEWFNLVKDKRIRWSSWSRGDKSVIPTSILPFGFLDQDCMSWSIEYQFNLTPGGDRWCWWKEPEVGDIVEYQEKQGTLTGIITYMSDTPYEIVYDGCCAQVKYENCYPVPPDELKSSIEAVKLCDCPIRTLMNRGCLCGSIELYKA